MGRYQNPADFLLKLAQAPELCNYDLDIEKLKVHYTKTQQPMIEAELDKYS